jgi:aldehyde:ferredoxin oxidoreductase
VRKDLISYYEELGWDELGIPREETLSRLGIEELAREVERIKRRVAVVKLL